MAESVSANHQTRSTPWGWAGPHLLTVILIEKFGQKQLLSCQSERYARVGVLLNRSTLADHVGAYTTVLMQLFDSLQGQVLGVERLLGINQHELFTPPAPHYVQFQI